MGFLKSLLFLGLLGVTVWGVQLLYVAYRAGDPVEISCADYLKRKPEGIWLKLNDCRVDLSKSVKVTTKQYVTVDKYYAPIVAALDDPNPHRLILELSGDDSYLAQSMFDPDACAGLRRFVCESMLSKLPAAIAPRGIAGIVKVGLESDDKIRRAISSPNAGLSLAPDWEIIELGEPPGVWQGILLLIPGLAYAAWVIRNIVVSRRSYNSLDAAAQAIAVANAPVDARIVSVDGLARRALWLAGIGWVVRFVAFVLGGVVMIMSGIETVRWQLPSWLQVSATSAAVVTLASLFFLLRNPRIVFWLALSLALLFAWMSFQLSSGKASSDLIVWFAYTAIFATLTLASFVILRVNLPVLGLRGVNLAARPRTRRPGWLASGRYLSIAFYALQGGICMLIGAFVFLFIFALQRLMGLITPIGPNLLKILGPGVVKPLMYAGSQAFRLRRCYSSPEARAVLLRDKRRPVLMLRSFADDGLQFEEESDTAHLFQTDRTFEELLGDLLWCLGPIVAIGRPNESVPLSGAVREYVSHDAWQDRVSELADSAELIVMILGSSEGFGWELQRIAALGHARKVVLIVPPLPAETIEARGETLTSDLGVSGPALPFAQVAKVPGALLATNLDGKLVFLRSNSRTATDYSIALDILVHAFRRRPKTGEATKAEIQGRTTQ